MYISKYRIGDTYKFVWCISYWQWSERKRDALSLLLFIFTLKCIFLKPQGNKEELELDGTCQLQIYAGYINLLWKTHFTALYCKEIENKICSNVVGWYES
jgi:hypothetical protein